MFQSIRHAQLSLRIGLALMFVWLGIDKFIMPQYWMDTWLPRFISDVAAKVHMAPHDLIVLYATFEILVAVSLAAGFFVRSFASVAIVALLVMVALHGLNETSVRDIGVVGALVALVIWPERSYH